MTDALDAKAIDAEELAARCERFMQGTKRLYDGRTNKGDMWFFELYHHLNDCAVALRRDKGHHSPDMPDYQKVAEIMREWLWVRHHAIGGADLMGIDEAAKRVVSLFAATITPPTDADSRVIADHRATEAKR